MRVCWVALIITTFNSKAASRRPLIFIALMVSMCQIGMWINLVYTCCYSNLSTNHVGCPIVQPRASLILLNIYYFRLNIFKKGTFKRLFEKRAHCQKTLGGGGMRQRPPLPLLLRRVWINNSAGISSLMNKRILLPWQFQSYLNGGIYSSITNWALVKEESSFVSEAMRMS